MPSDQSVFLLWLSRAFPSQLPYLPHRTKRSGPSVVEGELVDHLNDPFGPRLSLPASLIFNRHIQYLSARIDSGSEQNLIDQRLVNEVQSETESLPTPQLVSLGWAEITTHNPSNQTSNFSIVWKS
ncbi:hypothetical protein ATANTOWER_027466 [Ataeniobius toweri]|uniref:Uncharacterized protein n=1 Tax=Ataeniobius toweri TaxID=208326 RepID=A0ABU7ATN9_9TELE|nr:hypothetical protein [Ataeniobius toweri]